MMAFLEVGQRVVRSATWSWKRQDGGEGHLGTVVMLTSQDPVAVPDGWAKVRWDNGYCNNYQVGSKGGNYDLLLFDNASAGVVHPGSICDSCGVNPIAGMRWKCCDQSCPDYNLCTPCYMNDEHDLTHKFTRFNSQRETGTQVAPRLGADKTISRGLCPEAEVSRGEDWQGGAEHDDSGGTVLEACAISERPRSGVTVRWTKSKSVTTHRVGYDGKVDLKYTKPGAGTTYYSRHLPVLGEEVGLKVGDHVTITMEIDKLQEMQQMAGCDWSPRMKNLLAKVGKVTGINSDGNVEIVYPGRETNFLFHPDVLNKIPVLTKGDLVRVNATLNNVKYLQDNSKNGWLDDMEECLGREGTVVLVDSHFSAAVRLVGVEGDVWWHPGSLTLVKRKQSTSTDDDTESIGVNAELGNTEDEQGADDDGTQFVRAAEIGDLRRVLKILSSSPEKVNVKVRDKTALHKASVHGHLEVVKALIEAGAEIHVETTGKGKTPLHYAVQGDEPAVTKYLTEKGADVNRGSAEQRRPIHTAAYGNFVDCARILISHGCDVNVQDTSQDTPLHDAILENSIDVAAMLLNVPNIDTTLTNKKEMTPMQYTALIDRPEIAGLIAKNYPESLCIRRQSGHTILHIAAVNNHVEVMKVVLAVKGHGLCLDTENNQGLTALHLAALEGFSESTEFLVSQGANVNIQSKYGHSPLHLLAKAVRKNPTKTKETSELKKIQMQYGDRGVSNNAAALLCFMVLHGAYIDAEDVKCRTPLYHIEDPKLKKTLKQIAQGERVDDETTREDVEEDQDAEMENLMTSSNAIRDEDIHVERNDIVRQDPDSAKHYKYDFDVKANWTDHQIRNPANSDKPKLEELDNSPEGEVSEDDEGSQLIRAARIGDLGRVLEILSSSPEKVNVKVQDQTALHKASIHGHLEVVKALIEAGADIESTTSAGHTPLHYSVEGDEPVITKYLIEKGADVNRGSARQSRAIHRAAFGNFVDCARILINHGCDVNVQDKSQDTPLHDAILKNSVDVAEMLLEVPNIDTTLINNHETTPLHYAAMLDRPELAELIAQHFPASISALARHGYTVLHIAAVNNHVEVLKVVLAVKDHGLCLDSKIEQGLTALHIASHEGNAESIEFLVSQGAKINIQTDDDGHSPLHLVASAVRSDPKKIKETPKLKQIQKEYKDRGVADSAAALLCFMVLHGASIHIENVKCRTPLYYIEDPKLKKTLKQIARGERANDVTTPEDIEEGEGAKIEWRNTIRDTDVIVERNDQVHQDPDSPKPWKHYKNEVADNAVGSDRPSGNPTKPNSPQIEIFDLVHKIQVCDLEMGPVIGQGQFGAVHRASWRGTPVAVKKISFVGSNKDEVEKEVAVHRRASHPNIVQILALGYKEQEAFIVMQLIKGASLRTIIFPDRDDAKITLDWPQKLQISREVLQAVTFMHAYNILHLDIKPANILVEETTTRPFICDLGLAHIKSRNGMSQTTVNPKGTPSYMPPEALCASGEPGYRHSSKHDIWSLGGTLVVLFSMNQLWGDLVNPMALLVRAAQGTMGKPEALTAVDLRVKKILEPCFNQNPEERPSALDLLNNFNDLS